MTEKILVIKLSALGDFILALGPMEAIRRRHKDAHITLLTTQSFVDIAERSGYFSEIIIDARPKLYDLLGWYSLYKTLNTENFTRVYDLQLNKRSARYYKLFRHKPEWSGVVPDSPLFYSNPDVRKLHAFKRHQEILKVAGIDVQLPDLSWMASDVSIFGVKSPYVLLVPGSIGNDTGPIHLIAQAGCPVVALFCTTKSNAARSAPVGKSVQVIEAQNLEDVSMIQVYKKFDPNAAA